jgi:(2Fe-2S) ferredoxin
MDEALTAGLKKAAIATAERHIFLCMGPDCCTPADAEIVWEYIKRRVRETSLHAMRTKAQCLRICTGGPWLVVYPEGTWYGAITIERFEQILQQHLLGGRPIAEWITATNGLGCRSNLGTLSSSPDELTQ